MRVDRPLISIRERRQIDLFDLALVVVRRRPWPLLWASVGGCAPFFALNAWVFAGSGQAGPTLGFLLWWFEAPLASAPLTVVLGGMMFGETPSPRTVAGSLGRSFGALILAHGVLRFMPFYWLPPRLMFSNEVILLERGGWRRLWPRGAALVGGRDGDLFLLSLLQPAAVWVFALAAYVAVGRLLEAVLAVPLTWDWPEALVVTTWVYQVPIWIGVVFLTVVRFLTYIDQRIRLEGWEIRLRLYAAGDALTEARRW